jgi:predicted dehydrogenase
VHGAKYFRRWHAQTENSGGLLVHKATHHFDLVNWLLSDEPESVAGFASLRVYGKNGSYRGERCSTCAHAEKCRFVMTLHKVEQDKAIFDELISRQSRRMATSATAACSGRGSTSTTPGTPSCATGAAHSFPMR